MLRIWRNLGESGGIGKTRRDPWESMGIQDSALSPLRKLYWDKEVFSIDTHGITVLIYHYKPC